ncbi:bifunctional acetate--CoA ligase family protein/GNAT family N-acetyltransferase [Pseudochelatococcus contaminans]|uniref:Acetyltransferase n=1 Tax=Pseudochelatococcus contaminans TaxID=1538103 RepID=A0A7W6EHH2_9HYPH|nr:bifunctional acetate--CoA ligase family protein/GNAT family N-acetyltransferase [Pseudochelatococcus contaminans]MBB3810169.1 acetyltransferase [Pseudochelatococcus contaminans]
MSTYNLEHLFSPRSIAIVADEGADAGLVDKLARNIAASAFSGQRGFVGHEIDKSVNGNLADFELAPSLKALTFTPDLIIIASPVGEVLNRVAEAGAKGVHGAVIVTEALAHDAELLARVEAVARSHSLRLVGPNSIGIIAPHAKLNASFAGSTPIPGDLALITQSGALAAGVIEWATTNAIGFSAVASIGGQIDVDFGDLLDYFALDRHTRAILLYVETVEDARKFMSAARLAARAKPVVVIKSGRHEDRQKVADTHTAALATPDAVYDAAFRRAGLLRVIDLDELFAAAETLGRVRPFLGKRLAIVTNGGGIGKLTVDRLIDFGGALAEISPLTLEALDKDLPPGRWSRSNPIDLGGDADAARYATTLQHVLADRANDGVLVLNVPLGAASSVDVARAVIEAAATYRRQRHSAKPILTVWYGDAGEASDQFAAARIPNYATEAEAVRGFTHLVRYREALNQLMETPPSLPADFNPDTAAARGVIDSVLASGRNWLDPVETEALFDAYQIPITPVRSAKNADEAVEAAEHFFAQGLPVAVKILSPDVVHKSDIGGVRLNLVNGQAVRAATEEILERAARLRPEARIHGVTIHPMMVRPKGRELIAGIADDPVFGPVVVFGRGGTAVEVINDRAIALPPLDLRLAHDLISRTRVSRRLKAYRDVPAADERAVALTLVKLAQLAADLPEVREIDINPLLADHTGVIGVDARVKIAPVVGKAKGPSGHPRFAIRPYPQEWERLMRLSDGTPITMRPVRPEDEEMFRHFFTQVTPDDLRLRFFTPIKDFSHTFIARLTQLDYGRAMAFVAVDKATGEMLGAVRLHADANYEAGEYGIMTRTDMRGKGLGWLLMNSIIEYARAEGLKAVEAQVLRENTMMLAMCAQLGFKSRPDPDDAGVRLVRLDL